MTKKERAAIAIERLKKEYPDAGCTLDYNEAWKLLVSVRLAAQCTDAREKGEKKKKPKVHENSLKPASGIAAGAAGNRADLCPGKRDD